MADNKDGKSLEQAARKAGTLVDDDANENLPPKSTEGPGGLDDSDRGRQQTVRHTEQRPDQVKPQ